MIAQNAQQEKSQIHHRRTTGFHNHKKKRRGAPRRFDPSVQILFFYNPIERLFKAVELDERTFSGKVNQRVDKITGC